VLQSNGLVVNPDKCLFGCTEVEFLGHRLTAPEGSAPCLLGFRPSSIFPLQTPSSSFRHSWAFSISTGDSSQRQLGSSPRSPGTCVAALRAPPRLSSRRRCGTPSRRQGEPFLLQQS
jgi:hypothetical protein